MRYCWRNTFLLYTLPSNYAVKLIAELLEVKHYKVGQIHGDVISTGLTETVIPNSIGEA